MQAGICFATVYLADFVLACTVYLLVLVMQFLSILLQFIPGEILTKLNTIVGWSRAIGQQTFCCFVDRFVFANGI